MSEKQFNRIHSVLDSTPIYQDFNIYIKYGDEEKFFVDRVKGYKSTNFLSFSYDCSAVYGIHHKLAGWLNLTVREEDKQCESEKSNFSKKRVD